MNSGQSLEEALDELERRLDLLDQKVNLAIEQSLSLLQYVRDHRPLPANGRAITRRIILEETSLIPESEA